LEAKRASAVAWHVKTIAYTFQERKRLFYWLL
jgi:hypothetical protein